MSSPASNPRPAAPSAAASDDGSATASGEAGRPDHGIVAGRYQLLGRIAEGGMGVVYKAEHTLSRKKLAIKILHPHLCHGRQAVERFKREVSAAAEIDHHGIVQVFDAGVDSDGSFYMAMELLEGDSLGSYTRRAWPGTRTTVKLIAEMCEPLARAHAKGFVHRDLKPDNVFIARDHAGNQSVKLLDFGLVREVARRGGPTQSGITFGTPEYMAPEQAMSAKKAGVPADVWSVGVMLYELLSGQHPFSGETANAVMANAIKDPHPPLREIAPHVPAELTRVVEQCLEKEPSRRPKDAAELGAKLRDVAARIALDDRGPESPRLRTQQDEDDAGDDGRALLPSATPLPLALRGGPTSDMRPARRDWAAARRRGGWALAVIGAIALVVVLAVVLGGRGSGAEMTATELPSVPTPPRLAPSAPADAPLRAIPPTPGATGTPQEAVPPAPTVPSEAHAAIEDPATAAPAETEAAVAPRVRERPREPASRQEDGPSAVDTAQACLARGDYRCAVTALQSGRSAAELALLVDAYQMQGRASDARAVMQRYVQRFPRGARSDTFRRQLGLAGQ